MNVQNLHIGQITFASPLSHVPPKVFPRLSILTGNKQSKIVSSFPIQFMLSLNQTREFVEILANDLKEAAPIEPKPS